MKKLLHIRFVLVAFVIGFFLSPAIISRADGGDISLIHACVKDKGGDVKIVGANSSCPSGYSPLHWGITGPQGPQGIQGPPGPASLPSAYYQSIAPDPIYVNTQIPNFTTIGTFDLPAGKWALFVTVSMWLESASPYFALSCQIPEVSGMSVRFAPGVPVTGTQSGISLQMQNLSDSSAGTQTLTLQCTVTDNGSLGWFVYTWGASLMAIQVAP